ncbi:MAG: hypothetical protein MZV65_52495 [Chromatiales bacterium]|nr:hypothetical protein [Chromatiales bacterium]
MLLGRDRPAPRRARRVGRRRSAAPPRRPATPSWRSGSALVALDARQPRRRSPTPGVVALRPKSVEAREALAAAPLRQRRPRRGVSGSLEQRADAWPATAVCRRPICVSPPRSAGSRTASGAGDHAQAGGPHPGKPVAHYALAHLAVRVEDLDTATTAIDQALALEPDAGRMRRCSRRGCWSSRKDIDQVLRFYESYLDDLPARRQRAARATRAAGGSQTTGTRRASSSSAWCSANPEDADAAFTVALLALQVEDLGEAEMYLRRTLELQRGHTTRRACTSARSPSSASATTTRSSGTARSSRGEHRFDAQARARRGAGPPGKLEQARAHLRALDPRTEAQRVQLALAEEQILRDAQPLRRRRSTCLTGALR